MSEDNVISKNEGINNVNSKTSSSHCDCYKYTNRTMSFTIEKKRQAFLQEQKVKRKEAFDEKRDLLQLFEEEPQSMECESSTPQKKVKKYPMGFKLMQSEWLTEIPDDLREDYLVKFCVEGVHYLVAANNGITTCYYRNGRSNIKFKSKLPGGDKECRHRFTVLDCIYNKDLNTLFVYDVLAWNSLSLLYADANVRFHWLQSKFNENPEMLKINERKNFNFVLMQSIPGDLSLLQDTFFTPFIVNEKEIVFEGVLFYHKEGHYVSGKSPLVGWMKSFMVPEILHIDVHPSHLMKKPEDYVDAQRYLKSCRKNKKKKICNSMEMDEVEEVEEIECES